MVFAAIKNYNSLTPIIISAFIDISYWEHKAANLPRVETLDDIENKRHVICRIYR